jgi:hypothetical protein
MSYKNLNSSIPSDFFEYLEAAGYSYRETTRFHGLFNRGNVDILVSHLSIEVRHGAGADRLKHYVGEVSGPVFTFSGLDHLKMVDFMFLMEITGAVKIKELFAAAGREEIEQLVQTILQLIPDGSLATVNLRQDKDKIRSNA